jgi:hypothetical protein
LKLAQSKPLERLVGRHDPLGRGGSLAPQVRVGVATL